MSDRFDKFTERAKKVLVLSQEEAQRFNHNYIGTEHLLLGLLREEQGIAAAVLRALGAGTDRVRDAVEHVIGRGDRMVIGDIALTPRAKRVIELAVEEARGLDHAHVGTEHLLLGLVREREGIAVGVLTSLGLDLAAVRAAVLRAIRRPEAGPEPGAGGWRTSGGARLVRRPGAPARGPDAPDADLRELVDVLPVGTSHRAGDETVTLLSVERYRDGFLAQLRVLAEYAPPAPLPERAGLLPEVHLAATDDRGGAYTPWPHGGSGGGGRGVLQWRHAYRFAPALPPEARELRLTVERVAWHRYEPGQQELVVEREQAGPWAFTVALPPPPSG